MASQLEHGITSEFIRTAEEVLTKSPFLCLNRFTLADILLWAVLEKDEKVCFMRLLYLQTAK